MELVAYEMSPALYPILFDQIKIIVEKFFDGGRNTYVREQWMILLLHFR